MYGLAIACLETWSIISWPVWPSTVFVHPTRSTTICLIREISIVIRINESHRSVVRRSVVAVFPHFLISTWIVTMLLE